MTGSAHLDLAGQRQNPRFGKRLGDEIYVASEASATSLANYAPQSNFSAPPRVSLALDSGNTDAIQPCLSNHRGMASKACRGHSLDRRVVIKHLISDGFSS
jgi:hypothetical protein